MFEYEYRVRHGSLSFALLRPVHPIHADIADNVSSKLITLPLILAAAAILALIFRPAFAIHAVGRRGLRPGAAPGLRRALPPGMDAGPCRVLDHAGRAPSTRSTSSRRSSSPARWRRCPCCPLPLRRPPLVLPFRWTTSFPVELLLGRVGWSRDAHGARRAGGVDRRSASFSCGWSGGRACASTRRWAHEVPAPALWTFFRVGRPGRAGLPGQLLRAALRVPARARHGPRGAGGDLLLHRHPRRLDAGPGPGAGRRLLPRGRARSGSCIQPSMEQLIESVRDGTLDFTLTKPEDAQLLVQHPARGDLEAHRRGAGHRGPRGGPGAAGRAGWARFTRRGSPPPSSPEASSSTASG